MASIEQMRTQYKANGGGEFVADGRFAISSCALKEGKGGTFAVVELRDPSGSQVARCFDAATIKQLDAGGFVEAKLRISTFNNGMSAIINSARTVEVDAAELLRYAGLDVDAHARRLAVLQGYLAECEGTIYGDILREIFAGDVWDLFTMAPAAVRMHHAEPGGLVRHLYEVARGGLALLESTDAPYDRPYFLAGVFLHDIGKLDTYTQPPTIAYTAQGQLGEHQIWSTFRLAKACAAINAPRAVETKLLHIIEQAHGAFRHAEWQDPLGVEAKALAAADFFSSRLGTTERERKAQDALDALIADDAAASSPASTLTSAETVAPPSDNQLFAGV